MRIRFVKVITATGSRARTGTSVLGKAVQYREPTGLALHEGKAMVYPDRIEMMGGGKFNKPLTIRRGEVVSVCFLN